MRCLIAILLLVKFSAYPASADEVLQCAISTNLAACFALNGCTDSVTTGCDFDDVGSALGSCGSSDCGCVDSVCTSFSSDCCPGCGQAIEDYFECALDTIGVKCDLDCGSNTDITCGTEFSNFISCGVDNDCDLTTPGCTGPDLEDNVLNGCSQGDCSCLNSECTSFVNSCCPQCGQTYENYLQCDVGDESGCNFECGDGGTSGGSVSEPVVWMLVLAPVITMAVLHL